VRWDEPGLNAAHCDLLAGHLAYDALNDIVVVSKIVPHKDRKSLPTLLSFLINHFCVPKPCSAHIVREQCAQSKGRVLPLGLLRVRFNAEELHGIQLCVRLRLVLELPVDPVKRTQPLTEGGKHVTRPGLR
jgi:hypothetical protein